MTSLFSKYLHHRRISVCLCWFWLNIFKNKSVKLNISFKGENHRHVTWYRDCNMAYSIFLEKWSWYLAYRTSNLTDGWEGHLLAGPGSLGHLGNIESREVYSNLSVLQEKSGGRVLGLASRPWEGFKCLKVLRKIPAKQAQKGLGDQLPFLLLLCKQSCQI